MATVFASGATLGPDGVVVPVVDVGLPSNLPPADETPEAGSGRTDAGPAGEQAPIEPPVLDDAPDDESAEDAADDGREGRPSRRERRRTYVQGLQERYEAQLAEQRRELEALRRQQAGQPPEPATVPPQLPPYQVPPPQEYQFGTQAEYLRAMVNWEVQRLDHDRQVQWQAQQQAQAVQQAQSRWQQREEEGRERYEDFDVVEQRVEIAPHLAPLVADTVRDLEIGADILYFLGTNPKAQKKLNQMDVWAAGRWLGQLQLQLEGKRQRPSTGQVALPSAPASPPTTPPMHPVGTGGALPVTGFRQGMSLVEYDAQRRQERQALGLRP